MERSWPAWLWITLFLVAAAQPNMAQVPTTLQLGTMVLTQGVLDQGIHMFRQFEPALTDFLLNYRFPTQSASPRCGFKYSVTPFSGARNRVVKMVSIVPQITDRGIRVDMALDLSMTASVSVKYCKCVKVFGKKIFSICTSRVCNNGRLAVNLRGLKISVEFNAVGDPLAGVRIENIRLNIPNFLDPVLRSCSVSSLVRSAIKRWVISPAALNNKVLEFANKQAADLNQKLVLPQTFSPTKGAFITYQIGRPLFAPNRFIEFEIKATVNVTVNGTVIPYQVPASDLHARMLPPRGWGTAGQLRTPDGQPLMAELRISSAIIPVMIWIAEMQGVFSTDTLVNVMDATIHVQGGFDRPQSLVPALDQLHLSIPSGLVNVTCINEDAKPASVSNMLSFSIKNLIGAATLIWRDGAEPGFTINMSSIDSRAVEPKLLFPLLPIPPELLDELLRFPISKMAKQLNEYFQAAGVITIPEDARQFMMNVRVSLVPQGEPSLKHGYVSMLSSCICGGTGNTACLFPCDPPASKASTTTTTSTPAITTYLDETTEGVAGSSNPMVLLFDSSLALPGTPAPLFRLEVFPASANCSMSEAGASMTTRSVPSTGGKCSFIGFSNIAGASPVPVFMKTGPSATSPILLGCSEADCTTCAINVANPSLGSCLPFGSGGDASLAFVPNDCVGGASVPADPLRLIMYGVHANASCALGTPAPATREYLVMASGICTSGPLENTRLFDASSGLLLDDCPASCAPQSECGIVASIGSPALCAPIEHP